MARTRMVKPGFFKNEVLAELRPPAAAATTTPASAFAVRLCFEGLWLIADRLGRLPDRPRWIKSEIFPYDGDVDVEALLVTLAASGFIRRYVAGDGEPYIAVVTFSKHQHPHRREAPSEIPPPPPLPSGNGSRSRLGRSEAVPRRGKGGDEPGGVRSTEYGVRSTEVRTNTHPGSTHGGGAAERVLAAARRKRGQEPRHRGRFR